MDDIQVVAAALSEVGTVGILIAFVYAIWRDHQIQEERLYQITRVLLEKALDRERDTGDNQQG